MSRFFGCKAVLVLAAIAALSFLTAFGGGFYHSAEERRAFSAFIEWKENPSPETEARWREADEAAGRKLMQFHGIAISIGLACAVAATIGAYRLIKSGRKAVPRAPTHHS